jgi:hypothetical protein
LVGDRTGFSSEVALGHDGEPCNSEPVRERSSRCCPLEFAEAFTDLRGHGEVLLTLVTLERLLERGGGLLSAASSGEHLGEVTERVSLEVEPVRPVGDRDRLAGEPLGLGVLAAVGVNERLYLPPKQVGDDVLLVAEFAPELSQRLGFVVET